MQLVEQVGPVAADPGRQHVDLERRGGDRRALEQRERVEERVGAVAGRVHAVPRGQEPGQHLGVDRLDLVAQAGEAAAPDPAQHPGVAPLALGAVGPELAPHDAVGVDQRLQRVAETLGAEAEAHARRRAS